MYIHRRSDGLTQVPQHPRSLTAHSIAIIVGEMPGYPSNKTCFLYTGFGIQMSYHSDMNYTGRGAKRAQNQHKPPPPPPGPCATQQAVMPVKWPKYDQSTKLNIRFDLCNITTENDLKEDSCVFWDRVFPINASYPPGQDYHTVTQVITHRLRCVLRNQSLRHTTGICSQAQAIWSRSCSGPQNSSLSCVPGLSQHCE